MLSLYYKVPRKYKTSVLRHYNDNSVSCDFFCISTFLANIGLWSILHYKTMPEL